MKGWMPAMLPGLAPVGLHKVYGEQDGTNSTWRKAVFIVRREAAAADGAKAPAAVWGRKSHKDNVQSRFNQARGQRRGSALHFPRVSVRPSSITGFCIAAPADKTTR